MSDLGWFLAFAGIAALMIAISAWMAWFSRRAMRSHKRQIEEMIREMREAIDERQGPAPPEER